MAPSLHTLPFELIEAIVNETSYGSRFNVRLTCRAIAAATRHSFIRDWFSVRILYFEPRKIQELALMSKVPDIATAITTLRISCDNDGDAGRPNHLDERFDPAGARISTDFSVEFGPCLALALQHLVNLKRFIFHEIGPFRRGINITTGFATVVGAMQACDMQPVEISVQRGGLIDDIGISRFCRVLSKLERLQLTFVNVDHGEEFVEPRGRLMGQQLARTMPALTSLKELNLDFGHARYSQQALHGIASCTSLPPVQWINLVACCMTLSDLFHLMQGCCTTLQRFSCYCLELVGRAEGWLTKTLCLMRDNMQLEYLSMKIVSVNSGRLRFPGLDSVIFRDVPGEKEYIKVESVQDVLPEGEHEVRCGLPKMLDVMVVVPW